MGSCSQGEVTACGVVPPGLRKPGLLVSTCPSPYLQACWMPGPLTWLQCLLGQWGLSPASDPRQGLQPEPALKLLRQEVSSPGDHVPRAQVLTGEAPALGESSAV